MSRPPEGASVYGPEGELAREEPSRVVTIEEVSLAADPDRWRGLGFRVEADRVQLGTVQLRLAGSEAGRGILGWSLRGLDPEAPGLDPEAPGQDHGALDGLEAELSGAPERPPAPEHPNGISALDHIVAMTPALDRTIAALQVGGLDLRRVREEPTPAGAPRQAFFRLGEVILEVVQEPPHAVERGGGTERPARLWGIAMLAPDLERTAQLLGDRCGEVRDAVQPGRRIATLRAEAGLGVPIALMSPVPAVAGRA